MLLVHVLGMAHWKSTCQVLFVCKRQPAGATILVREIEARFGLSIHRVSLDQALARREKKRLPGGRP